MTGLISLDNTVCAGCSAAIDAGRGEMAHQHAPSELGASAPICMGKKSARTRRMPEVIANMVHCAMGWPIPAVELFPRLLIRWLFVMAVVGGCSGRAIQLGDGPAEANGGANPDGSDGNIACPHAQVAATEVLWTGDSWVQTPGTQHSRVRDLASAAGAIGPNDNYAVPAVGGARMVDIADQYDTYEAGSTKVKVLITDGGGWDTILSGGSDASVASVGQTFTQHMAKIASDGTVQHVIYFLYPELSTIAGVTALRPVMQQVCASSTVPCYFLDLNPLWTGHPEYTAIDNIQASEMGAVVIADHIWDIMQRNCIAQ